MSPSSPVPRKAVVLLSGGLDSATVLAIAASEGFATYAMTFRYGQRHGVEVDAASRVAAARSDVTYFTFAFSHARTRRRASSKSRS